jgi:hypothetical protein
MSMKKVMSIGMLFFVVALQAAEKQKSYLQGFHEGQKTADVWADKPVADVTMHNTLADFYTNHDNALLKTGLSNVQEGRLETFLSWFGMSTKQRAARAYDTMNTKLDLLGNNELDDADIDKMVDAVHGSLLAHGRLAALASKSKVPEDFAQEAAGRVRSALIKNRSLNDKKRIEVSQLIMDEHKNAAREAGVEVPVDAV